MVSHELTQLVRNSNETHVTKWNGIVCPETFTWHLETRYSRFPESISGRWIFRGVRKEENKIVKKRFRLLAISRTGKMRDAI